MDSTNQDPRPRAREVGQVYVTYAAAQQYARAAEHTYVEAKRLPIEEARRDLTELALEARRVDGDASTPESWRFRRQSIGVDLSLRIVRERSEYDPAATILVVVSCNARARPRRTGRKQLRRG